VVQQSSWGGFSERGSCVAQGKEGRVGNRVYLEGGGRKSLDGTARADPAEGGGGGRATHSLASRGGGGRAFELAK